MDGAVRIALRIRHNAEVQNQLDILVLTAFHSNAERLGHGTLPAHHTKRITTCGGTFGIEPGIQRIPAQLGLGLSENLLGLLIDFEDDTGLVSEHNGQRTALHQRAHFGLETS